MTTLNTQSTSNMLLITKNNELVRFYNNNYYMITCSLLLKDVISLNNSKLLGVTTDNSIYISDNYLANKWNPIKSILNSSEKNKVNCVTQIKGYDILLAILNDNIFCIGSINVDTITWKIIYTSTSGIISPCSITTYENISTSNNTNNVDVNSSNGNNKSVNMKVILSCIIVDTDGTLYTCGLFVLDNIFSIDGLKVDNGYKSYKYKKFKILNSGENIILTDYLYNYNGGNLKLITNNIDANYLISFEVLESITGSLNDILYCGGDTIKCNLNEMPNSMYYELMNNGNGYYLIKRSNSSNSVCYVTDIGNIYCPNNNDLTSDLSNQSGTLFGVNKKGNDFELYVGGNKCYLDNTMTVVCDKNNVNSNTDPGTLFTMAPRITNIYNYCKYAVNFNIEQDNKDNDLVNWYDFYITNLKLKINDVITNLSNEEAKLFTDYTSQLPYIIDNGKLFNCNTQHYANGDNVIEIDPKKPSNVLNNLKTNCVICKNSANLYRQFTEIKTAGLNTTTIENNSSNPCLFGKNVGKISKDFFKKDTSKVITYPTSATSYSYYQKFIDVPDDKYPNYIIIYYNKLIDNLFNLVVELNTYISNKESRHQFTKIPINCCNVLDLNNIQVINDYFNVSDIQQICNVTNTTTTINTNNTGNTGNTTTTTSSNTTDTVNPVKSAANNLYAPTISDTLTSLGVDTSKYSDNDFDNVYYGFIISISLVCLIIIITIISVIVKKYKKT